MGIGGYLGLIHAAPSLSLGEYDMPALYSAVNNLVNASIERDVSKWQYYGVLPSNYIRSPQSPFYPANKEIVEERDPVPSGNPAGKWSLGDSVDLV